MSSRSELLELVTPYAVYGTLRPGCGNDVIWHDKAVYLGSTIVKGYRLLSNGYFPYAVPAEDEQIVVDLIAPNLDSVYEVRRRLDRLEGYPNHYDRVLVPVWHDESQIQVWLYTPQDIDDYLLELDTVPGNDWLNVPGALVSA